jgi:hypothetical protein
MQPNPTKPSISHRYARYRVLLDKATIVEEPGLPSLSIYRRQKEPCIGLDRSGRLPAIENPNKGIALFVLSAIVECFVDS